MDKKDRIAVAISALYLLFALLPLVNGEPAGFLVFLVPLVGYWGWRFAKGDISFLK